MDTSTPRLYERLNQLNECVRDFFGDSYDPQKNKWKTLDNNFRHIEEHIAVVLIYDFLGETDGFEAQHPQPNNPANDKACFGLDLANIAVTAAQNKGIDTASLRNMAQDISNHNPNSHGNDIPDKDRENKGRTAVLNGLDIVLTLLADKGLTDNLSSYVREGFERLYKILSHSKELLSPGHIAPEIQDKVQNCINEVFKNKEHLPTSGDYDYVLILPKDPDEELIQILKPLMMIMRFSIVVDPGFENGPVYTACKGLRNVEISNTALTRQLSEVKTNWIFLNGRQTQTSPRELRLFFQELSRRVLQMKNIIVFDLTADKSVAEKALLKIWKLFNPGSEEEPSDHTTIFSTVKDSVGDLRKKLNQSDYDANLVSIDISPADFISTLIENRWLPSDKESRMNLNSLQYLSSGIKFLSTPMDAEKNTIWDSFYSGRTLSVKDLENDCDVYPRSNGRKLFKFSNSIKDALSAPDGQIFHLYHQPGAGGTSLARRLAYNFSQKCQNPEVLPVFITKFDAINTMEMLGQLSEAAGARTTLLIIADDKEINENEFQSITQNIHKKGIHCVVMRIRHILSGEDTLSERNSFFLASSIQDGEEINRFDYKFRNAYSPYLSEQVINGSLSEIHAVYDKNKSIEMIYYPYTFCERMNKENHNAVFVVTDSFVSNWFSSIKSSELKMLCGYIALAYHFSASKAVDIYSLSSVWRREGISTLDAYPADDIAAINKILKVSNEDYIGVGESTLRAPRYAAFAKKILTAWQPAWCTRLSSLAVDFTKSLPQELTERDQRLLMDMFIQQVAICGHTDDESGRKFEDRFSPLIGHILENEGLDGAKAVFQALIERYPSDLFYQIHYARLLFEYAHSIEADPDDTNFNDASKIIRDVIAKEDEFDSFHHIAGMYWRRVAKAIARSAHNKSEGERVELISYITDATDKALKCFDICNELNRGTSSYGYVSTAELIISTLRDIKKLLPPSMLAGMLDNEPYLSYMEVLDTTIQHLSRPQFTFEFTTDNKLDFLRNEYLRLIGDTNKAIEDSKHQFESASDPDKKRIYGHRAVTLMLEQERKKDQSRFQLYSNMNPSTVNELSNILKILSASGDLRSAEQYFHLCRYTRHDQLTEGETYAALTQWEGLATEKNNQQQRLMASFYLYVCYAVKILNLEGKRNQQFETEYMKHRDICRDIVGRLKEESYSQVAFAGNEHTGTWDCILDTREAFTLDARHQRLYTPRCRRENALIVGLDRNQGDCEIHFLKKISFSRKGIVSNAIGNELKNGVIGFRYRGVGLYDFTTPKDLVVPPTISITPKAENTSDINHRLDNGGETITITTALDNKSIDKTMANNDVFRTESEMHRLAGPKIIDKIDLSSLRTKKNNRR